MKKSRVRQGLLLLLMVFFCAVIMLPFLIMFFTSLKTSSEIAAPVFRLLPEKWLFSNYADAMKSSDWGRFFYNTFFVTVVATGISLVINSMAGYAFARLNFKGRDMLFMLEWSPRILLGLSVCSCSVSSSSIFQRRSMKRQR